jgi:hypothetical protein
MKFKTVILLFALIATGYTGFLLLNRNDQPTKASEPKSRSMFVNPTGLTRFKDLKCLAPLGEGDLRAAFIVRDLNKVNPKGVSYRDVWVALEIVDPVSVTYSMYAVDYRKGECSTYYTGDSGEVPNPISRVFGKKDGQEAQLIWEKWKLKHVPGWRERMQKRLNRPLPILSDEEVWALKQLGYKMPKQWKRAS